METTLTAEERAAREDVLYGWGDVPLAVRRAQTDAEISESPREPKPQAA